MSGVYIYFGCVRSQVHVPAHACVCVRACSVACLRVGSCVFSCSAVCVSVCLSVCLFYVYLWSLTYTHVLSVFQCISFTKRIETFLKLDRLVLFYRR